MHATLPWPVSPEFEDALALATQRHLARPVASAPSSPHHQAPHNNSLQHNSLMPAPATPNSADAPRSASLMMKTRVAVRDKTPHRFQVVPLRDAAQQNRDKAGANSKLLASQPPAPWIRQLAVLRPSGVGLGLGVPIQRQAPPCAPDTPERGRRRARGDVFSSDGAASRKGVLRGLQGLSPRRAPPSPEGKENRIPHTPTRHRRRRQEYAIESTLENSICTLGDTTITASTEQEDLTLVPESVSAPALPASASSTSTPSRHVKAPSDITATLNALAYDSPASRPLSRHFKCPSLGAVPAFLPAPTPTDSSNDDTPRVRCRKRTNTLSAGTKRYGKLDFSPVSSQDDANATVTQQDPARASTYSLGALLAAYSYDSLPSLYSQESFVEGVGTQALRVRVRALPGEDMTLTRHSFERRHEGHPHAILRELMKEVDVAIGEWL